MLSNAARSESAVGPRGPEGRESGTQTGLGFGIYVHVPFCPRKKCPYCGFNSYPVDLQDPGHLGLLERYVQAVLDEARMRRGMLPGGSRRSSAGDTTRKGERCSGSGGASGDDAGSARGVGQSRSTRSDNGPVERHGEPCCGSPAGGAGCRSPATGEDGALRTVYFGGGTPTLLSPVFIRHIIQGLFELFEPREASFEVARLEVTLEVRPGTCGPGELFAYREAGVNRVSIGVQSFSQRLLDRIERGHLVRDSIETVRSAFGAGLRNVGVDLIFGLPGQTKEMWRHDLVRAVSLGVSHISAYHLEIEEGTPFHLRSKRGLLVLPGEEESREMYEFAGRFLPEHGYERYEVSNFALPGFECKHNMNYWRNGEYLGLGAGAHSHLGGVRFWNEPSYREYMRKVAWGELPTAGEEEYELRREIADTLIMGLRLQKGVSLAEFGRRFGVELDLIYPGTVDRLCRLGLLVREGETIRLTDEGMLLANQVWSEFA